MDLPVGFGAGLGKRVEETQAILVVFEDSGALIAAIHEACPAIALRGGGEYKNKCQ
jgi:hypothetical protein